MAIDAAYDSVVRLNASVIQAAEWTVETDGGLVDITTFEDAGFEKSTRGVRRARITVRGFWDAAANLHANPPQLLDGYENTNLKLYPSGIAVNLPWTFPVYTIEKVRMMSQVREGIKLDFDARNFGTWTYPGGFIG